MDGFVLGRMKREIADLQGRIYIIEEVMEQTKETEAPMAGALFELQASIPDYTAAAFLKSYYGNDVKEEKHIDNVRGFYHEAHGHIGTYNANEGKLYFGGTRTKDDVKKPFQW